MRKSVYNLFSISISVVGNNPVTLKTKSMLPIAVLVMNSLHMRCHLCSRSHPEPIFFLTDDALDRMSFFELEKIIKKFCVRNWERYLGNKWRVEIMYELFFVDLHEGQSRPKLDFQTLHSHFHGCNKEDTIRWLDQGGHIGISSLEWKKVWIRIEQILCFKRSISNYDWGIVGEKIHTQSLSLGQLPFLSSSSWSFSTVTGSRRSCAKCRHPAKSCHGFKKLDLISAWNL